MPAVARISATELNVRQAACPACGAQPGSPCTQPGGPPVHVSHFPRREAAIAAGYHSP